MNKLLLGIAFLFLLTINADAAARFLVACNVTCTWDGASTAIWSTTSGGSSGASVPGSTDDVTLDANTCTGGLTCTITVNTNVAILSLTMGACTGTTTGCILDFSINNNTVSMMGGGLSSTGSGVRTLRMGSGNWSFNPTANTTIINFSTVTNFTLTAGTSTIVLPGPSSFFRTIIGNTAVSFNNLLLNANTSGAAVILNNNSTYNNITLTAPSQLLVHSNATITATSLTLNGAATTVNYLSDDTLTSSLTGTISVASGTQTLSWVGLSNLKFVGGATFVANNSFALGFTSGITINAPPSVGSSGCILGGWLLWRDLPNHINDNFPAWLEKVG